MKIWNCSVFPQIKSAHSGYQDQVIVIMGSHLRINFEIFLLVPESRQGGWEVESFSEKKNVQSISVQCKICIDGA